MLHYRAPFKPGVPLVKPHLVVVFVLNLTANLLVRAGLDIPDHIQNLDELAAYWKMDVNKLITTDPNASPQLAEHGMLFKTYLHFMHRSLVGKWLCQYLSSYTPVLD